MEAKGGPAARWGDRHRQRDRWGHAQDVGTDVGARAWSNASTGPVAAGRLTAAGSAAPKLTAKLLAINPGWLLYPMGSVTTGRVRHAEQLGVELPVPIRVTEYRLRHGHSQTDGCWSDASSRQLGCVSADLRAVRRGRPGRTTQERLVPRAGWWSATSATT